MSKLVDPDYLDYFDPHKCRDSCIKPGLNCQTCTNPAYFSCKKKNVSVCIHPSLECDGHPQCDDAEDENLDRCYSVYLEREIVTNYATLKCYSKMYPNMLIIATVCDSVFECGNDEDEPKDCKNNKPEWLVLSVIIIVLLYIIIRIMMKIRKLKRIKSLQMRTKLNINSLFQSYFEHKDNNDTQTNNLFNLYFLFVKFKKTKKEKKLLCRTIYIKEEKKHHCNEAEIFCCMHNNLEPQVSEMIIGSNFPGFMEKHFEFVTILLNKLERCEKYQHIMYHVTTITGLLNHYSDSLKDFFIFYQIFKINGGMQPLIDFPTKFSSVVVILFGITIFIPIVISSIHLAKNNYIIVYDCQTAKTSSNKIKIVLMKFGILLLSVVNPILLTNTYETIKEKTRKNVRELNLSKLTSLLKMKKKINMQLVNFLYIDLTLECIYQIFGQIILVFLSRTATSTTGGMEVFFETESLLGLPIELVLSLSIIWSVKTCIMVHLKSIKADKLFIPFMAKIVVLLWSTMATARRILSLVAYFIPSLGLFNLLYHWKAEQIPFARKLFLTNDSDTLELYNMTEKVLWSDIDRWKYKDVYNPTSRSYTFYPPKYDLYTGLDLGQTFLLFIILLMIQFLLLLLVKCFTVDNFWLRNHYNKFVHILENMNMAIPWQDWDQEKCSVEQHTIKHRKVNIEMAVTMIVNMVFSLVMICPLLFTGNNLKMYDDYIL